MTDHYLNCGSKIADHYLNCGSEMADHYLNCDSEWDSWSLPQLWY